MASGDHVTPSATYTGAAAVSGVGRRPTPIGRDVLASAQASSVTQAAAAIGALAAGAAGGECPPSSLKASTTTYFDQLLREAASIDQLPPRQADQMRVTRMMLNDEIHRVWQIISARILTPAAAARHHEDDDGQAAAAGGDQHQEQQRATTRDKMVAATDGQSHTDDDLPPMPLALNQSRAAALLGPPAPTTPRLEAIIPVPQHENPAYNFIGRILGPRGMSVKQLEQDSGCKILVRGRGSVKDADKERRLLDKRGWEHLSEPLHILVVAEVAEDGGDDETAARRRLQQTADQIRRLLSPVENDEYKRGQLMQLAIINGTYRPTVTLQPRRPMTTSAVDHDVISDVIADNQRHNHHTTSSTDVYVPRYRRQLASTSAVAYHVNSAN